MPAAEAEAQAPPQDLESADLSGGSAKPLHRARGPFRLALPREPASRAGDEAGRQPRRAQHKGLSPGAAAAAGGGLEPPAEKPPGPSSPPSLGGGCCLSPRGSDTEAPGPLLPLLRWARAAAQPPPLRAVGAPRSMSEESDMEKAIKVRGRCLLLPRLSLWHSSRLQTGRWRELGMKDYRDCRGLIFPGFRGLRFTALWRQKVCVCREGYPTSPTRCLKRRCGLCSASREGE